ncbi:hypothetical protein RchiOBHm_Chr7g0230461 [Rosa chinensis]|uniref:Uncharacterized protein n=1 Tax=Rosa chinensis TaxID=74649 RepID=A0A2P6PFE6_ROSCH|nr:hypothetical protein RchiOBHm_Chr7g0230461 [Rosa chinensis]
MSSSPSDHDHITLTRSSLFWFCSPTSLISSQQIITLMPLPERPLRRLKTTKKWEKARPISGSDSD